MSTILSSVVQKHPRRSALVALAVAAALFWGVRRVRGPEVPVVVARRAPLSQRVVVSGRVTPPSQIQVASQLAGTVTAVRVQEGDVVEPGAPLFELEASELDAAVAQAEAALGQARARLAQLLQVAAPSQAEAVRQAELSLKEAHLGFIFQFHHLLPAFTALENVAMPMAATQGRMTDPMRARAAELLEQVGLSDRSGNMATALSGGQQQRVAIARALVMRPPLVLADEPTGNLDTHTSDQVFELLRRFNREHGVSFLIVTHDPRLAERCDRIVEIVDGRIVSDRPVQRVR